MMGGTMARTTSSARPKSTPAGGNARFARSVPLACGVIESSKWEFLQAFAWEPLEQHSSRLAGERNVVGGVPEA